MRPNAYSSRYLKVSFDEYRPLFDEYWSLLTSPDEHRSPLIGIRLFLINMCVT